MPRGGRRPGAGRKPKTGGATVLRMDGTPHAGAPDLPPAVGPAERASLLTPPKDLSAAAKTCWRQWAPRALDELTLTPSTEAGFRELCIRMANVRAIDRRIARLGIASQDALPYLRERRGQAAQLNTSLKDFKLSAFGKPATSEKPKPTAANPFTQVFG